MATNYTELITKAKLDGLRVIPFINDIRYVDYVTTPIYTMVRSMNELVMSPDAKIKWAEGARKAVKTTINFSGGYSAAATSIVVTDATIFTDKAVVINNRSTERMMISDINYTTNTLTVIRGWGESTAASITDGDTIALAGSAAQSGGAVPDTGIAGVDEKYNYIQHFSTPIKMSDYALASDMTAAPGERLDDMVTKQGDEHARELEAALIAGTRGAGTVGSLYSYSTGGLLEYITTNKNANGGSPTTISKANMDAFLTTCFDYGSTDKYFFCGSSVYNAMQKFASDGITQFKTVGVGVENANLSFGIQANEYQHSLGRVFVIRHRTMDAMGYNYYGIVVDPMEIKPVTFQAKQMGNVEIFSDTVLRVDMGSKGHYAETMAWETYLGYMIMNEKTMGYIYNVTGGA